MNHASSGLWLLLGLAACTPARAPDTRDGGAPDPSASAVAVSATAPPLYGAPPPSVASTAPSASATSPSATPSVATASAPSVEPSPPALGCQSVDDCWVSAKRFPAVPIARPKHLKGKKFKPCVDGEVAPTCTSAGACALLGYDC